MSNGNEITLVIDGKNVDFVRKDSVAIQPRKEGLYEIGKPYFVETVTKYYHGTLVEVTPTELAMVGASWIPQTGRFHQFATGAQPEEMEPYAAESLLIIGRGAVCSALQIDGIKTAQIPVKR